jgi:hypothetical protein
MGQGIVIPDRGPPVRAEVVHECERSRVTRLFFSDRTLIRKEPLGPDAQQRPRREVEMLQRLRGAPGVAQLAKAADFPGSIMLVDASGTSPSGLAKPLGRNDLIELALKSGRVVAGMHFHGLMHCDITPANLVISCDGAPQPTRAPSTVTTSSLSLAIADRRLRPA